MTEIKNWVELTNLVMKPKKVKAEAIFVHGWGDLHQELLKFTIEIFNKSGAKYIVLNGAPEYEFGSPGFDWWQKELIKMGISKDKIVSIGPARHTNAEAHGFMNFAQDKKLKSAIVISVPQHIIRAFLNNLGFIEKLDLNLKLYPITLPKVDWQQVIEIDSIGGNHEITSRLGRLAGEFARIIEYRKKAQAGNSDFCLASVKEGLEYLANLSTY